MTAAPATAAPYPVVVTGRLDPPLSRWLWLVKWLLVLPHVVVLAALWAGYLVVTLLAFVAILATGRYPAPLFAYTVGVLRWSWRVAYYAYGALGTDRYPPFTLADVPDYPARLVVAEPERLSRGLVLVKAWLLALPHWAVLVVLLGTVTWTEPLEGDAALTGGTSLLGLLVLVAGVVVLVRGRYPEGLHALVVGLDRWVLRVAAYVSLMTDVYPPFRLDQGGAEGPGVPPPASPGPGSGSAAAGVAVPSTPPAAADDPWARPAGPGPGGAPTGQGHPWTGGRVTVLVAGALLVLLSFGVLAAGGVGLWADRVLRDEAGFVTTGEQSLATPTAALVSEPVELAVEPADDLGVLRRLVGTLRLTARADGDAPVFVGLAPSADVAGYLDGVAADRVRDLGPDAVRYERLPGTAAAPPTAPAEQVFWEVSAQGPGAVTVDWDVDPGSWTLVVMRADGEPGVGVGVSAGVALPVLDDLVRVLLVVGAVLLVAGGGLVAAAAVSAGRRPPPGPPPPLPRQGPPDRGGDRGAAPGYAPGIRPEARVE